MELSERNKQKISETKKKDVKHLVESLTKETSKKSQKQKKNVINSTLYQRHLLTEIVFFQNHAIRRSLLFWLVKQIISILLNKEDHLVGLLRKHLLLGSILMSVTSAKKGKYNIMGRKLAQQQLRRFRLRRSLKLQQKLKIRRCTTKLNTLI